MKSKGIYVDSFFAPNPKCIVFATLIAALYAVAAGKRRRNNYLIPVLFVSAYVAMAWYDHVYDCDRKMRSGRSPMAIVDSTLKPQQRGDQRCSLTDQEQRYRRNVYMLHALVVAPLLLYYTLGADKRRQEQLRPVVASMAGVALLYHAYRMYDPRTGC